MRNSNETSDLTNDSCHVEMKNENTLTHICAQTFLSPNPLQ